MSCILGRFVRHLAFAIRTNAIEDHWFPVKIGSVGEYRGHTRGRQAIINVEIIANGECPGETHCQTSVERS